MNILKMDPVQKKAYKSWKDQGSRCGNPNDPRFLFSGAKGIKRLYSSRDFIGWYEQEWEKLPGSEKKSRVHVGRINHDDHYKFGNVALESASKNTKERNQRHGNPCVGKSVIAENWKTGEVIRFDSKRQASRELGLTRNTVNHQLSDHPRFSAYPNRSGWNLRYA